MLRLAGRKLLAILPDGTVRAVRATADKASDVFAARVAPALRAGRDRLVGIIPDGVRRRLGTRITAVVALAAVALLSVSVAQSLVSPRRTVPVSAEDARTAPEAALKQLPAPTPSAPQGSATGPGAPKAPASPSTTPPGRAHEKAPRTAPPAGRKEKVTPKTAPSPKRAPAATPPKPIAPPVPAGVSPAQLQNAKTIAKAALDRGLPAQAVTIALATAMQESTLLNLNYGDRDSLGLFQQRPSQGWGTEAQIMDPYYAAGKFYDALVQIPGWQSLRVTDAAQLVQRSAFPEAYQQWVPLATGIAAAVVPVVAGVAVSQ